MIVGRRDAADVVPAADQSRTRVGARAGSSGGTCVGSNTATAAGHRGAGGGACGGCSFGARDALEVEVIDPAAPVAADAGCGSRPIDSSA